MPRVLSDQYLMTMMAKQGRNQMSQMPADQVHQGTHPVESNVASHLDGPLGAPSRLSDTTGGTYPPLSSFLWFLTFDFYR